MKNIKLKEVSVSRVIENKIYLVRHQKVMFDIDLADLYGVPTKQFNRAILRNKERFPDDFMFQLTAEEEKSLRCQIGTSKVEGRGGRRYLPYMFTEQGVAMLSSVLKSENAIKVNIAIMRAFVKIRQMLASHKDLAEKLEKLEQTYDAKFRVVFDAIKALMRERIEEEKEERQRPAIGFEPK